MKKKMFVPTCLNAPVCLCESVGMTWERSHLEKLAYAEVVLRTPCAEHCLQSSSILRPEIEIRKALKNKLVKIEI